MGHECYLMSLFHCLLLFTDSVFVIMSLNWINIDVYACLFQIWATVSALNGRDMKAQLQITGELYKKLIMQDFTFVFLFAI